MDELLDKAKGVLGVLTVIGGLLLALAITSVYLYAVVIAVKTAGEPPLVADPLPASTPQDSSVPLSQARGAVDQHKNMIGVIAVISPLVTTIVGFYFGARVGAAGKEAAETKTALETTHAIQQSSMTPEIKENLITELRTKGLI